MNYYKNQNKKNGNKKHNAKPHHAQNYIWVVYNLREGRNHTFTNKMQALRYYYSNESRCLSVKKCK